MKEEISAVGLAMEIGNIPAPSSPNRKDPGLGSVSGIDHQQISYNEEYELIYDDRLNDDKPQNVLACYEKRLKDRKCLLARTENQVKQVEEAIEAAIDARQSVAALQKKCEQYGVNRGVREGADVMLALLTNASRKPVELDLGTQASPQFALFGHTPYYPSMPHSVAPGNYVPCSGRPAFMRYASPVTNTSSFSDAPCSVMMNSIAVASQRPLRALQQSDSAPSSSRRPTSRHGYGAYPQGQNLCYFDERTGFQHCKVINNFANPRGLDSTALPCRPLQPANVQSDFSFESVNAQYGPYNYILTSGNNCAIVQDRAQNSSQAVPLCRKTKDTCRVMGTGKQNGIGFCTTRQNVSQEFGLRQPSRAGSTTNQYFKAESGKLLPRRL